MFKQLFESLQNGDKIGFDRAFPACYERLRYLAYGILKDSEKSKDAVQDVFEKILKQHGLGKLPKVNDPDKWAEKVARNHCLSQYNVEANRERITRDYVRPFLPKSAPGNVMEALIVGDIQNCLDSSFTPKEASVWELIAVKGMKRPKVCDQLDISDNRLRAYISEMKKKVKKCIGK